MKKFSILYPIVFLVVLLLQVFLASQKLLWTDELFTQRNLENVTYRDISKGSLLGEGNTFPLYYLIQKTLLVSHQFKLPYAWKGEAAIYEPFSQVFLRLPSILFMSIALTLLFYFLAQNYNKKIALIGLLFLFTNPMIWIYGPEGRPYALFFLLSSIQMLILTNILQTNNLKTWKALAITHIFLSLTIIFSIPQILFTTFIIWYKDRSKWLRIIPLLIIPLMICAFYYIETKKTYTWIPHSVVSDFSSTGFKNATTLKSVIDRLFSPTITTCLPLSWLTLFLFTLILITLKNFFKSIKEIQFSFATKVLHLLSFMLIISAIIIVSIFDIWKSQGVDSYSASERYFIFIIPFILFSILFGFLDLHKSIKDLWWRRILIALYLGVFIISGLNAWLLITSLGTF